MRELFAVYLKGFSMGSADVVPGVSGATIALILGIYDRLIRAITTIDPRKFRSAWRLHEPAQRAALRAELERIDAGFLAALGLGIATAIVVLSRVLHTAVTEYPVPTYGFFFGLISASAIVLYGEIDRWPGRRLAVSIAGIAIAAAITGVTATGVSHGPAMVVLAGAIAVCAMILPGISGAFFLLLLGQYEFMTATLTAFVDGLLGLAGGGTAGSVVESGTVVALYLLGTVIGLFTMAHVVRRALESYRAATLAFLVSLMVGALRLPATEIATNVGSEPTATLPIAVAAGAVGVVAVLLANRYTSGLEYDDPAG
ncbi:DUF368 domain-containing protein [Natrinema thermotolerans]|uniref:DUF368 domain-containing protein n=1 Tax=Natrinema thermotolerans TaxID=121872 RepID=A0AAF0PC06_9EURY|nr:DUF368 domain-containing protein [Natrinema thermotolerans]QCC59740.1 DUF368 domain-containing protein [Natrinema thermotolerans]WMT06729.1 DUF368 domain-containing protein [Natrinema thermotolerans]